MEYRQGDIFRWKYTPERLAEMNDSNNAGTTYWCASCIAVFDGERFVDTYWGSSSDNKTFKVEDVNKKILITYLGNFDELEKASDQAHWYYREEDIVDLRHANNSSRNNIYIRKGAQRDVEVMRESLKRKIEKSESTARVEADWAKKMRETLERLTEENKNDIFV